MTRFFRALACVQDDLKTQVAAAKKQLAESAEHQSKGDTKLNTTLQNLSRVQEEKGSLENRLGQKQAALQVSFELAGFRLTYRLC